MPSRATSDKAKQELEKLADKLDQLADEERAAETDRLRREYERDIDIVAACRAGPKTVAESFGGRTHAGSTPTG